MTPAAIKFAKKMHVKNNEDEKHTKIGGLSGLSGNGDGSKPK